MAASRSPVAVIVVTWNAVDVIRGCLESVLAAGDLVAEVVVVDNASSDGTRELVSRVFPGVVLMNTLGNTGFAPACNLGLVATTSPEVLLLNPDARLLPEALARLIDEMVDCTVGLCGPRIVRTDGSVDEYAARRMPTAWRTLCRLTGIARVIPSPHLRDTLAGTIGEGTGDVPCLTGAALLVRRDLLECDGGLDTTMPMYLEDLELCDRCHRCGFVARYAGSAAVEHAGGFSSASSQNRSVLSAMEDGHAPWLHLRRVRGRAAAERFRAAVLVGSFLRVVLLLPTRLLPRSSAQRHLDAALRRSISLIRWSLTSPREFEDHLQAVFEPLTPHASAA